MTRPAPVRKRVAVVGFHSHGDRSFLDDRDLALIAGDLVSDGVDADRVAAFLEPGATNWAASARMRVLVDRLARYDVVVYERVWDRSLVAHLFDALPGRTFVHCRGEHELADPPAHWVCTGELRHAVVRLVAWLEGRADTLAPGTLARGADGLRPAENALPSLQKPRALPFRPALRAIVVPDDEPPPRLRTFSVLGNVGCPYQADARENPLYAGVELPEGAGRGCAFCTTGNRYEHRPDDVTAADVLAQLRWIRTQAPEIRHVVLKDQNPFGWLDDVIEACAAEKLGPLTLMLETRADWFLRSRRRLDRALEIAASSDLRIAPYLVGIESFSQPELDRYNKGIRAETNVAFLEQLWAWRERWGDALDLSLGAFGFVLFSPWTTLDDLRANLAGIERTRLHELRGNVLLSRARLYPDTALYWLARRDGLLATCWASGEDDNARRYGYYPAHPWRFQDAKVARLADLAVTLTARLGGRDQPALLRALLEAFDAAPDPHPSADEVLARMRGAAGAGGEADARSVPADAELRARVARLLRPLALEAAWPGGARVDAVNRRGGAVELVLACEPDGPPLVVELALRSDAPGYARSRHYDLRYRARELTPAQRSALDLVREAVLRNDA